MTTATRAPYEMMELLGVLYPASYNSEQNLPSSGFYDMSKYHGAWIEVFAGNIGTALDLDVEVATDNSGTDLATIKSITQLTEAGGDDNSPVGVRVRAEELHNPSLNKDYRYMRVEVTPNGATLACVAVYGIVPRYAPVSRTIWDEIVD